MPINIPRTDYQQYYDESQKSLEDEVAELMSQGITDPVRLVKETGAYIEEIERILREENKA